jgi:hypothetical protein
MFVIMASAQSHWLTFTILDATVDLKGKGSCLRATAGIIEANLPETYSWSDKKEVGGVMWEPSYSYNLEGIELVPFQLVEAIEVHLHIDGSFRRLAENVPEDITMLMIGGCTEDPVDGVQYCIHAMADSERGYIGTVTRTGPSSWYVDAKFLGFDQGAPSLCVHELIGGEPKEGFCIPLYDFGVMCTGTITK